MPSIHPFPCKPPGTRDGSPFPSRAPGDSSSYGGSKRDGSPLRGIMRDSSPTRSARQDNSTSFSRRVRKDGSPNRAAVTDGSPSKPPGDSSSFGGSKRDGSPLRGIMRDSSPTQSARRDNSTSFSRGVRKDGSPNRSAVTDGSPSKAPGDSSSFGATKRDGSPLRGIMRDSSPTRSARTDNSFSRGLRKDCCPNRAARDGSPKKDSSPIRGFVIDASPRKESSPSSPRRLFRRGGSIDRTSFSSAQDSFEDNRSLPQVQFSPGFSNESLKQKHQPLEHTKAISISAPFGLNRWIFKSQKSMRLESLRAEGEGPSLRDKVAISSNLHVPWSRTAELISRYSSKHTILSADSAMKDTAAMELMNAIRTQEDISPEDRRRYSRALLVHPAAPWLHHWMSLIYMCLMINLIMIPFRGIFDPFGEVTCGDSADLTSCSTSGESPFAYWVLELCIDIIFGLDMLLNFRIGYYQRTRLSFNHVVMDGRRIALHYMRLWFWLDLISVMPWYYMNFWENGDRHAAGRSIVLLRNVRMIRLIRLFKFIRIRRYFQNWHAQGGALSHPLVSRLMRYFFLVMIVAHLMACVLFLIPQLEGVPDDSWVVIADVAIQPGRDVFDQYATSIYWTLMTLTTVGYGDVALKRPWERTYASFCMVVGAVMFAYTVSNVAQLVREFDAGSTAIREKMDAINQYMSYRALPSELQSRIRKYYSFYWSRQSVFNESSILNQLPSHLRREVTLFLHKDMISKVPVFQDADSSFIAALVTVLAPLQAAPGDYVAVAGEVGLEMFFIDFGHVAIWSADLIQRYRTVGPGDFFGEVAVLTRERRTATCQAVTYAELWSLSRDDLDRLLEDYPEMRQTMKALAMKRLVASMKYAVARNRAGLCDTADEDDEAPAPAPAAAQPAPTVVESVAAASGGSCAESPAPAALAESSDAMRVRNSSSCLRESCSSKLRSLRRSLSMSSISKPRQEEEGARPQPEVPADLVRNATAKLVNAANEPSSGPSTNSIPPLRRRPSFSAAQVMQLETIKRALGKMTNEGSTEMGADTYPMARSSLCQHPRGSVSMRQEPTFCHLPRPSFSRHQESWCQAPGANARQDGSCEDCVRGNAQQPPRENNDLQMKRLKELSTKVSSMNDRLSSMELLTRQLLEEQTKSSNAIEKLAQLMIEGRETPSTSVESNKSPVTPISSNEGKLDLQLESAQ